MADAAEDPDIITLVTSNDPPVELRVERIHLLDSSVFSDMFSLPKTGDSNARVDVAKTEWELGPWLKFLRSGKLEAPDPDEPWFFDPGENIGSDAARIAKLVDKYACTSSRLLLIDELWRLLAEACTHPLFIVRAGDHLKADHVQRHAVAEAMARRERDDPDLEQSFIDCRGKQWMARTREWQALLAPARDRLIIEESRRYDYDTPCEDCQPGVADVWREFLLGAGHDQNPVDSFSRALWSYPAPPRCICPTHREEFYETIHEFDRQVRRRLPPFPPP